jgi:hypothetical protein
MHPSIIRLALFFCGEGNSPKFVQITIQAAGIAAFALLLAVQAFKGVA